MPHTCPEGAEIYYDTKKAIELIERIEREKPEGIHIWRCILCGWPIGLNLEQEKIAPACCCGGCGMSCLRPIEEYK